MYGYLVSFTEDSSGSEVNLVSCPYVHEAVKDMDNHPTEQGRDGLGLGRAEWGPISKLQYNRKNNEAFRRLC